MNAKGQNRMEKTQQIRGTRFCESKSGRLETTGGKLDTRKYYIARNEKKEIQSAWR